VKGERQCRFGGATGLPKKHAKTVEARMYLHRKDHFKLCRTLNTRGLHEMSQYSINIVQQFFQRKKIIEHRIRFFEYRDISCVLSALLQALESSESTIDNHERIIEHVS
jgi:hypothetical protein